MSRYEPLENAGKVPIFGVKQNGRLLVRGPDGPTVNMGVEPSKWAHLKGILMLIHIKFRKFNFFPNSATRGRFTARHYAKT